MTAAWLLVAIGVCLVTAGATVVSPAAGLIVGGVLLATVGGFVLDVGDRVVNLVRYMVRRGRQRSLSLDQAMAEIMNYQGLTYGLGSSTLGGKAEEITPDYQGFAATAYRANAVVFACMLARQSLFSEARFQFRRIRNGRPGDMFGTPELALLEAPWVNGTTGNLLTQMIVDADLDGNCYLVLQPDPAAATGRRVQRLRPDWVTIILGSRALPDDAGLAHDAVVIGYVYQPGGPNASKRYPAVVFGPEQVAHFNPIRDPMFKARGMSWLTPVVRDVMGDQAVTQHKLKFFEQGATPNMVVTLDGEAAPTPDAFERWVEKFEQQTEGLSNAYKTWYLGAGATATSVGANPQQADMKTIQGAGETRICAAAGVPVTIVGLSEGLQGSSLNAGNYGQARRRFADGTMRPLWREAAGSLQKLIDVPKGAELWCDDRHIAFLREDEKDAAEIMQINATTISSLITAGFTPGSVVAAVDGDALWQLLEHTGLYSVQLQPPGSEIPDEPLMLPAGTNGQP